MNKNKMLLLASMMVCSAPALGAVSLSQNGYGQGLLFPYVTIKSGQSTLVSLENSSALAKSVKLTIRGGDDGYLQQFFNVYVPAHGKWSASITDLYQRGQAHVILGATGCLSADPRSREPFYMAGQDTRSENFEFNHTFIVEAVELGELSPQLTAAMADCNTIYQRWRAPANAPAGAWIVDENADLSAPAGGLKGNALILDVEDGTSFGYEALAFNGLASKARQSMTHFRTPFLHHIEPAADGKIHVELIDSAGQPRTLIYNADQGMEALSALLAARQASVMVQADGNTGARTDVVVSFPTRYGFVGAVPPGNEWEHEGIAPILVAPFTAPTCETVGATLRDAGGGEIQRTQFDLCGTISVVQVRDPLVLDYLLGDERDNRTLQKMTGSLTLDFETTATGPRESRPDGQDLCYRGLPAWVLATTAYEVQSSSKMVAFPAESKAATETKFVDCTR